MLPIWQMVTVVYNIKLTKKKTNLKKKNVRKAMHMSSEKTNKNIKIFLLMKLEAL